MHVTSVAGMLKELDNEHSERYYIYMFGYLLVMGMIITQWIRLQRLEDEVAQLKARLGGTTPSSPAPSPSITKDSPVSNLLHINMLFQIVSWYTNYTLN